MLEQILQNVINGMTPYLEQKDMEHLRNVLYINFHNVEVHKACTELSTSTMDADALKVQMFIDAKRAANVKRSSIEAYSLEIKSMLLYIGKHIDDIKTYDLRRYFAYLREEKHLKVSTVRTRQAYASSFFNFLYDEELIKTNPMKKVVKMKNEKVIKKAFSEEDMEKMRDHCKNKRDRALVEFLYSTAVRVSESVSLRVEDVDMHSRIIIVKGKGNKERKTYLSEKAWVHLKNYFEERKPLPEEPLFASLDYRHHSLTKSGVEHIIRELGRRSGVPNAHPHRFRRTIITTLLNRGTPLHEVSYFAGHERFDTTAIYSDKNDESIQANHRRYA